MSAWGLMSVWVVAYRSRLRVATCPRSLGASRVGGCNRGPSASLRPAFEYAPAAVDGKPGVMGTNGAGFAASGRMSGATVTRMRRFRVVLVIVCRLGVRAL